MMKDRIQQLLTEIDAFKAQNKEELEQFRIKYLGKKGVMGDLFNEFKNVPGELRKEMGVMLNDLKIQPPNARWQISDVPAK